MISPETFARYAAMRVPRYTSYPTAPQFSPQVDSGQYRSWLRRVPSEVPISIYLHVPFCREMCWYCGCHTSVTRRWAPIDRYMSTLGTEIERVASELRSRFSVGHVHFGGGTPTLLTPERIEAISVQLRETFTLGASSEIAIEIDPRALTSPMAEALARAQINRASLGVQTFDPTVQAAINRFQSFAVVADAVHLLRRSGIQRINFDLLYGLPFQTVKSCLETLRQALELRPDRLAVFGYAHVPNFKPHQRKIDERTLPNVRQRQEQFSAMAEVLARESYVQIGLDHFARRTDALAEAAANGKLHRNFQGYTVDGCQYLLGFGASAIGRLPDGYVQNATRIADYERRISDGELGVVRGTKLSQDDRRRASIIEQLMCDYRADAACVDVSLDQLEEDGLIRRQGSIVEVTDEARPLVRVIAAAFDAYLPKFAATHAVAV